MGADNWAKCPKCQQLKEQRLNKVNESYGQVPPEDYLRLVKEAEETGIHPRGRTDTPMREDWEIGTDESGIFSIDYSCHCDACGFEFEYKFEKGVL